MPVVVAAVEKKTVALDLNLVGTARAGRTSRTAAQVEGLVQKVTFEEGDRVKAGAVLVELDKADLELGLQAARAARDEVRVRLEKARRDLERSASLVQARTISEQAYERDLFQVRTLEKQAARFEAEMAQLADRIRRKTIRAPFSGYVVTKHTEVGQWVQPGAPVATLVDLSAIKVRVPLPERYLGQIKPDDPAQVTLDALGTETFTGRVSALIPEADETSRNFPLEISLPNPNGRIKAGLLARVHLTGTKRQVLLAPKDALIREGGQTTVFVLKSDHVYAVPVEIGLAHGHQVEVSGDLSAGDMVVVQGNERLQPGQKVRVVSSQTENPAGRP